jgi:intracellular septation protein
LLKILADWIPIIVFFVAFKTTDIFTATGAAICATVLVMLVFLISGRRIENMQWISLAMISIFGGLTIIFQNEQFIKIKPTILYFLFALILLVPQLFGKLLIKSLLGKQLKLPSLAWKKLNTAWLLFFSFLGVLNLYIAQNYSTDFWVDFKLFGMLGITIIFTIRGVRSVFTPSICL